MNFKVLVSAIFLLVVSFLIVLYQKSTFPPTILQVICGLCLLLLLAILKDLLSCRVNQGRGFASAWKQYVGTRILAIFGAYMTRRLYKSTKTARALQEKFILSLLRTNEDTVFGRENKFQDIKDVQTYQSCLPLSYPTHYAKYVDMISSGKKQVLTVADPIYLGVTSGTSGKASILPLTGTSNFFLYGIGPYCAAMMKAYPATKQLQKTLKLMFRPRWRYTESGLRVGPISSTADDNKQMLHMYTTPLEGFLIFDEPSAIYIHLLFALKDREMGFVEANFSSLVYSVVCAMNARWEELVDDIERGTLTERLDLTPDVREGLARLMLPDAKRAQQLRRAYARGRQGLFHRLWPHLEVVICVDTGPFDLYRRILLDNELQGIAMYSPFYAATEGLLGVNLHPSTPPRLTTDEGSDSDLDDRVVQVETTKKSPEHGPVTNGNSNDGSADDESSDDWVKVHRPDDFTKDRRVYMLLPEAVFYEFLPVEKAEDENLDTLLMDEVSVGGVYELVLSTLSGLYRYRLGDVVRIDRMEGQCPVVEYMYRKGALLNVRGEKLNGDYFYRCLLNVMRERGLTMTEYSCVESPLYQEVLQIPPSRDAPYYVIFIELKLDEDNFDESAVANELDTELGKSNYVYSSFRAKGSINSPKVRHVKSGAFAQLRAHLLANTEASSNQVKIPRLLRRKEAVEMMSGQCVIPEM